MADTKKYYKDIQGNFRVKPRTTMVVNGRILPAGTKIQIDSKPTDRAVKNGDE